MKLEINFTESKSKKSKTPILFVHGAWHGAWCWEESFTKKFSERGYDNYSFSLRGHGQSPSNQNFNSISIKDYVDDLSEVVKFIGTPPIIIAHSMGGLILQKYLESNTCQAAILMASVPPSGVFNITKKIIFTKSYGLINILKFNLHGIVDTAKKVKWAFFSKDIDNQLLEKYSALMIGESYRAFLDMFIPNIKINYHKKIPMLTIGGRNDNIFSPSEVEYTAKKYDSDLKIFENIAHDMMLDNKQIEVIDFIDKWITEKVGIDKI